MKHLIVVFLLISGLTAQELRRPTTDANSTVGCAGTNFQAWSAMPASYDAAGQATSASIGVNATMSCDQFTCTSTTASVGRKFRNWAAPGTTYSALTLNVNSSATGWRNSGQVVGGDAAISYSLDNGVTWTLIRNDSSGNGWAQTTNSITLSASQDLSKLQVSVCASGTGTGSLPHSSGQPPQGGDGMFVYDIWTAAGTTPQGAGNGSSAGHPRNPVIID